MSHWSPRKRGEEGEAEKNIQRNNGYFSNLTKKNKKPINLQIQEAGKILKRITPQNSMPRPIIAKLLKTKDKEILKQPERNDALTMGGKQFC